MTNAKVTECWGDHFFYHRPQFEETRDAGDIRCFWQNFLHPSINKTRWSQEEVQQLKEISRKHEERHWEIIAQELGVSRREHCLFVWNVCLFLISLSLPSPPSQTGRTAFMCLQMFQRFVSGSLKRGSWTPAEDDLLRELVDKMRIGNFIPYTQSNPITLLHQSACLSVINEVHVLVLHANTLKPLLFPVSYFMEGRDPAQLIYRWNQVLDPSLKRGPWTKQEDKVHRGLSGYTIAEPHQCTISSVNSSERKYLFVFLWWDSAA